jgi:hypothetical protein
MGKSGMCTCWAYASAGSASANAVAGHTYSNATGCACQLATDPAWGN